MIYLCCPIYCHKVFYMILEALLKELRSLGYHASENMMLDNTCHLEDQVLILFGAQHVQNLSDTLEKNTVIVYNLEQLISRNWDTLIQRLSSAFQIWDYSILNLEYVKDHFPSLSSRHVHVPFGYSTSFDNKNIEKYTSSPDHPLITDRVAFIGNMSPRRKDLIESLHGLVTIDVFDSHYYNGYEDIVNKYQTFINLHFHPGPNILEVVRILPLLLNGRKVISERSDDACMDKLYASVVDFADIHDTASIQRAVQSTRPKITCESLPPWKDGILQALTSCGLAQFRKGYRIAVATLHCNNRTAIFEVIETFAKETRCREFTWVIFSQGCDALHNDKIEGMLKAHRLDYQLYRNDENMGWSRGMNALYGMLVDGQYDFVLHLEDDWLCHPDTQNQAWMEDCCVYLIEHPEVSTLFLRKYISDEDKYMYGWTREIYYQCFKHPHPFNYQSKIKSQEKVSFRSLTLRKIPQFLYSANPTLFRLKDYLAKGVFPFPSFEDTSHKQGEWKTTTMQDATQWGFSEALAMEKIRDLTCMNVDKGFFHHRN